MSSMAALAWDEEGAICMGGNSVSGTNSTRYSRPILRNLVLGILAILAILHGSAAAATTTILAFGDSLFAGYGLPPEDGLSVQLEAALKKAGHDIRIVNAGVSGDTTAAGLSRLGWSLADKPDLVLLELGANDALRGLDPLKARDNLDRMLEKLRGQKFPVLLIGMMAPRNLGSDYVAKFDSMYGALAKKYDVPLYPFLLDGVALNPALNQADGIHPNAAGVKIIVERLLPAVETALPKTN